MAEFSLGAGALLPAAGVAAVAGVATTAWFVMREPAPEPAETAPVVEAAQPAPEIQEVETPEAVVLAAPRFDVVNVEADGQALVAGASEPGDAVDIVLDGAVLATADAGNDGKFARFLQIDPSPNRREIRLVALGADGVARPSDQVLFVEPFALPEPEPEVVVVADAEPDSDPEPDPQEVASEEPAPASEPTVIATADVVDPIDPSPSLTAPELEQAVDQPAPAAPNVQSAVENLALASAKDATIDAPEVQDAPTRAPAVLLADSAGLRVLQAPERLDSIALDTITYEPTGEVSLGGRAPSDGFVRIYLDDRPITVSRISEGGNWRTPLPDVDTGIYTLRIDEVSADGEVTSRLETPFKREEPEIVASLQAPDETGPVEQPVMTVQPGTTLWAIARDRYGEGKLFVKVFEANRNRIKDPNLIYPGQVFDLPE